MVSYTADGKASRGGGKAGAEQINNSSSVNNTNHVVQNFDTDTTDNDISISSGDNSPQNTTTNTVSTNSTSKESSKSLTTLTSPVSSSYSHDTHNNHSFITTDAVVNGNNSIIPQTNGNSISDLQSSNTQNSHTSSIEIEVSSITTNNTNSSISSSSTSSNLDKNSNNKRSKPNEEIPTISSKKINQNFDEVGNSIITNYDHHLNHLKLINSQHQSSNKKKNVNIGLTTGDTLSEEELKELSELQFPTIFTLRQRQKQNNKPVYSNQELKIYREKIPKMSNPWNGNSPK